MIAMKSRPITLLIVSAIVLSQCAIHKKERYTIPPGTPPEMKDKVLETFEKGRKLYKANCSQCHGIFAKAKDGVPDFSAKQIDMYTSRFIMRDPTNHAVAVKMDQEQMGEVISYLRYRVTKNSPAADSVKGR